MDLDEMEDTKHTYPQSHSNDGRYCSFSSEEACAPFALSLPLIETSPAGANGRRRPSFGSIESSIPPGLLSGSSVGTMSPSTPLNGCSFSSTYLESFKTTYPESDLQSMWNHQHDDFDEHDFGYSSDVLKEPSLPKCFNSYLVSIHDTFGASYTPSYNVFSNDDMSPALSRPMFNGTIPSSTPLPLDRERLWPSITVAHTPTRTIDPSTFAPTILSTPIVKGEDPCTPSRQHLRSSFILHSSPMSNHSPGIVPSQHDVDDSAFFDTSNERHEASTSTEYEKLLVSMKICEKQSRLSRRKYERKGSSSGCKRRPLANKSGFECDRVITANSFACSYAECIDKNTGKQKRFKRQEHKKRHEKTVHQKESHLSHRCWVPHCERSFSRTDNLKSHLKNTHGKRSPNARNRYVATLDPNNAQYYNPDWEGDLTIEGLPMGRQAGLAKS